MNQDQSRQRKMLVIVLVLGLGGLAVDRLILGGGATGPDDASAESLSSTPITSSTPAAVHITPTLATRANTLAGRLDRTASEEKFELLNVDDAFRASPLWVKPPAATPEEKLKAKPSMTEAEAFAAKHKLMAVVNHSNGGAAAIIGTQTVLVGRTIDGFTLVNVTKRSAILERDGQRVELSLPEPKTGPAKIGD